MAVDGLKRRFPFGSPHQLGPLRLFDLLCDLSANAHWTGKQSLLADRLGVDRRTVRTWAGELSNLGCIKRRRNRQTITYTISATREEAQQALDEIRSHPTADRDRIIDRSAIEGSSVSSSSSRPDRGASGPDPEATSDLEAPAVATAVVKRLLLMRIEPTPSLLDRLMTMTPTRRDATLLRGSRYGAETPEYLMQCAETIDIVGAPETVAAAGQRPSSEQTAATSDPTGSVRPVAVPRAAGVRASVLMSIHVGLIAAARWIERAVGSESSPWSPS